MAWRRQTGARNTRIHEFTGDKPGKRQNVPPHINKDSTPDSVFSRCTSRQFLVCWWMRPTATIDTSWTHWTNDLLQYLTLLNLALIIQMGHEVRYSLNDYWTVSKQFLTPFYSKTMTRDRFLHILRYLHFANNHNAIDNNDPKYDRVWKIRRIVDILNDAFSTYCAATQHLAVDEVIVLFKGRVNFKLYISKKTQTFWNQDIKFMRHEQMYV